MGLAGQYVQISSAAAAAEEDCYSIWFVFTFILLEVDTTVDRLRLDTFAAGSRVSGMDVVLD